LYFLGVCKRLLARLRGRRSGSHPTFVSMPGSLIKQEDKDRMEATFLALYGPTGSPKPEVREGKFGPSVVTFRGTPYPFPNEGEGILEY
jgi:hypothetical protein